MYHFSCLLLTHVNVEQRGKFFPRCFCLLFTFIVICPFFFEKQLLTHVFDPDGQLFLCIVLVQDDLICLIQRSFLIKDLLLRGDLLLRLLLLVCSQTDITVTLHTGSGRDQLTDEDILLQTDQVVYLTVDRSLRKNLCCFLEGCCGQEGVCCQRCLCDTKHYLLSSR